MRLHPAIPGAAAAGLVLALGACGADTKAPSTTTAPAPAPGTTTAPQSSGATEAGGGGTAATPSRAAGLEAPLSFHLRRRAQLRTAPGGKVITTLKLKTEFRSPQILAVAGRRPGWVHVRTSVAHHGLGWLPTNAGVLFSEPRTIVIDLSAHRLKLFHRGKLTNTYKVAIGAPGTPTPTGTFAITDRLTVPPGTAYGCCILALTAHQDKIAQGWGGGDRVAIHATPDTSALGKSVSHGCVRGSNAALHELMRRVRLGTPVTIKA